MFAFVCLFVCLFVRLFVCLIFVAVFLTVAAIGVDAGVAVVVVDDDDVMSDESLRCYGVLLSLFILFYS